MNEKSSSRAWSKPQAKSELATIKIKQNEQTKQLFVSVLKLTKLQGSMVKNELG